MRGDQDHCQASNVVSLEKELGIDEGLRIFLIVLTSLILIVTLTGNVLILYGSIFRKAVKMEAIDLTQIYSNAVCDILLMVFFYIPILITLICNEYTLGDAWCTFTAYFMPTSIMVYNILTNAIGTVFRVWLLKKPPKVRSTYPISRVYWVIAACVVVAIAPCIIFPALGHKEECFITAKLSCAVKPKHNEKGLKAIWWIYTVFLVALPLAILMSANIYTGRVISKVLENSRTATKEQKCRVSLMISTICWSFLLSYIPMILVHIGKLSGYYKGRNGEVEPLWCLIPTFFLSIASVTNPFVLYISNVKFREYLNGLLGCGGSRNSEGGKGGDGKEGSTTTSSCKIVKKASTNHSVL
ncbi:rhodopsin-like [Bolinopsis microptera]|uniref:rhodopsin-like n=1 Tax=Bolinopsis microptera TaxID=2820187 RepID=UPI0030797A98